MSDPPSPPAPAVLADPALVDVITERADALRRRIAERTDRDIRIVCVTKGHPPVVAASALAAGFVDLGENYAQELRDKAALLEGSSGISSPGGARWHFIGRLQSNKVRLIAEVVALWQSIDSARLAEQVARRSPGAAVLVQVDLAGLPGRGGCDPAGVPLLVDRCRALGLEVRGLMGVGPPGPPESARSGFRLLDRTAAELGLEERSMGMSADAEVAVEEGATILRIGSALVGPRVR